MSQQSRIHLQYRICGSQPWVGRFPGPSEDFRMSGSMMHFWFGLLSGLFSTGMWECKWARALPKLSSVATICLVPAFIQALSKDTFIFKTVLPRRARCSAVLLKVCSLKNYLSLVCEYINIEIEICITVTPALLNLINTCMLSRSIVSTSFQPYRQPHQAPLSMGFSK